MANSTPNDEFGVSTRGSEFAAENEFTFSDFVGKYAAKLLVHAEHLTGHREEAEDLLQSVFLELYQRRDFNIRDAGAVGFAKNAIEWRWSDRVRARKARPVTALAHEIAGRELDPAEMVALSEEFEQLWESLDHLTAEQREAIRQRNLLELGTHAEIADALRMTLSQFTKVLERARKALRKHLLKLRNAKGDAR